MRARGQQQRHRDDRQQFAPRAIRQDRVTHCGAGEVAVSEDGDERTKGRRAHGNGDGHGIEIMAREPGGKQHKRACYGECDNPCKHAGASDVAAERLGVDFIAGEQKQEGESELRKHLDGIEVEDEAGAMLPEQCAAQQKQHDLRHDVAGNQLRNKRCDGGDEQDYRERGQRMGHGASFLVHP